jgi:hypothetical protein
MYVATGCSTRLEDRKEGRTRVLIGFLQRMRMRRRKKGGRP